jgi:hypothetical protein
MTPIEHYWPPGMLAAVFPERYGHLTRNETPGRSNQPTVSSQERPQPRYTVERIAGCEVIWLGKMEPISTAQ